MRLTLLLVLTLNLTIQGQSTLDKQLVLLTRVIEKNHYQPPAINDSFSSRVFDRMLIQLDPLSIRFTAQDVQSLETYRYQIAREMRGQSPKFTDQLAAIYEKRLRQLLTLLEKVSKQPINFEVSDFFKKTTAANYALDDKAWEEKVLKYYKMRVLEDVFETVQDSITTKLLFQKHEPDIRKKIFDRSKTRTEQAISDGIQKLVNETYLQVIASNFDPHTNFFEPDEKKQFDQALSSEILSFGFSLILTDGKYRIQSLSPGGAAWRTGSIHKNDEVTAIITDDNKPIALDGTNADYVMQELEKPSLQKIVLTVTAADGITQNVILLKQQQDNNENTVRGYVLNGSSRVGYIALPSFYTEWDNNGGSSCANDVAKEIVKLKRENISGLILDLRYNGGGSLQEALELLGIFIDIGPACFVKDHQGKTVMLKDPNRGTIYDGPLIIMINGQSASASELVAGTLQDYRRALIVGGRSFGKATMQSFFPLDTTVTPLMRESSQAQQYGYVKVTGGKLYRITGQTAQLEGVIPDIALPDAFEMAAYSERSLDNPMPADTIMKKVSFNMSPGYNLPFLISNNKDRLQKNTFFKSLRQLITNHKALADNVPLHWEQYSLWDRKLSINTLQATDIQSPSFTVENTSFDKELIKLANYLAETEALSRTKIGSDQYVEEAFLIINDIVKKTQYEQTL